MAFSEWMMVLEEGVHSIALIPGDLNGITVTDATVKLSEAVSHLLTKPIKHTRFDYNADYFVSKGIKELGEVELSELKKYDSIFEGAIGDPTKIKPGIIEVGLLLKLRQAFDQYVNLRPVVLPEGVPSIIYGKTSKDINFEICRENSEGLYAGVGRIENAGTDNELAIQEMRCSYKGVRRLAEYAAERALLKGAEKGKKPTLHFVFKDNVLTYAASPWTRVLNEFRDSRKDIDVRYMHIDNFMMQMVVKPGQFDVALTENMFGDIATDLGAVLQGGIGTAVSGNIDPLNRFPSMFEPIHGSAPDKWYETKDGVYVPGTFRPDLVQQVKPEAAFMSYAMMLEHLGEKRAGEVVKDAALNNIRSSDYSTTSLDELVRRACNIAGWTKE